MGDSIRATAGESFDFTYATNPRVENASVTLEALYGIDGLDTGTDVSRVDLTFPVTLSEGTPGVYSTQIILHYSGPFWARVSVDGSPDSVVLVRVVPENFTDSDAKVGVSYTLSAYVPTSPSSVQIGLFDSDGSSVGLISGAPAVWPQAMSQVPTYADSWYFESIEFTEKTTVQVSVDPNGGPPSSDVITVDEDFESGSYAHFDGWEPSYSLTPSQWIDLSYIRRWTGWSSDHVNDEQIRELRRMAIETFIDETRTWMPAWEGTWHALRGQGRRLYLPVPLLLPQDGGIDPVVEYTDRWGDQTKVETISNKDLIWGVRGRNMKQPWVEMSYAGWDHSLSVKITGTWGGVGSDKTMPLKFKQVLVGLMRWHSLSFGVDADDAKDQSTLFRISAESVRDGTVRYDSRSVGSGLTGDRTIDRALAEYTVQGFPWARKNGDLPPGGRR